MNGNKEVMPKHPSITNPQQSEGILSGMIRMQEIDRKRLFFYLEAARQTGFQVHVVAGSDEIMLTGVLSPKVTGRSRTGIAQLKTVVVGLTPTQIGRDKLGISIERPLDKSTAFANFFIRLNRLEKVNNVNRLTR